MENSVFVDKIQGKIQVSILVEFGFSPSLKSGRNYGGNLLGKFGYFG